MAETDFSDEMLMRYADGELDAASAEALERAMEADAALAERVGMFLETRALAQNALKPLADEPVPEALTASVERMIAASRARRAAVSEPAAASAAAITQEEPNARQRVVPFPAARPRRARIADWRLPIAASVAAVLGGLAGYWLAPTGPDIQAGLRMAGIDSPALAEALALAPSGTEVQLSQTQQRFRAIGTFRDAANAVCREFELDSADRSTVISVACRHEDVWQVTFAVVAPGGDSGYAPASSTEALDAYLSAIEALPPMPLEEEARTLAELRR
jgi:anti-sigma factor RsiW